jgi:hypothetical protein
MANTPVGYAIVSDDSETVKITACHAWGGLDIGVYIDNAMGAYQGTVIVTGSTITTTNHNIQVVDGSVIITGNLIRGGASGVRLSEDADIAIVNGNLFHDVDYVINAHANFTPGNLILGKNYYNTINTAFQVNWDEPTFSTDLEMT